MRVDIGKGCLGIADGLISTNMYRVMALDLRKKLVFALYHFYDGQQIISEFITQICLEMSIGYSIIF